MVSIPPWFDFAGETWSGGTITQKFQSHLGSILPPAVQSQPTLWGMVSIPPWFDFAWMRKTSSGSSIWFQSHLGSILPARASSPARNRMPFQSHLGSILPKLCPENSRGSSPVSIPPWFDFAPGCVRQREPQRKGFNPTLVRFCPPGTDQSWNRGYCFNPTLVRFCPAECATLRRVQIVSIPPWFDFARKICC